MLQVTNIFAPNTIADANEVNVDNDDLVDYINSAHHQDADGTLLVNADIAAAAGIVATKFEKDVNNNVILDPGADGRVIRLDRHPRRDDGANSYQDAHIQSGWFAIAGDNTSDIETTESFPIAFDIVKVRVVISSIGRCLTYPPNDEGGLSDLVNHITWFVYNISASGFSFKAHKISGVFDEAFYYCWAWIAIGPVNV